MKIAVLHWSTSSVGGINTSLQTLRKVANDKGDIFHVFACDDQKTKKPCNIESKLVRGGDTYILIDGYLPHHENNYRDSVKYLVDNNYDAVMTSYLCPHPTKDYGDEPVFEKILQEIMNANIPIIGYIHDAYWDSYAEFGKVALQYTQKTMVAQKAYAQEHVNFGVNIIPAFIPFTHFSGDYSGIERKYQGCWLPQWKAIKGIKKFVPTLVNSKLPVELYSNGIEYYYERKKDYWKDIINKDYFADTQGNGIHNFYGTVPVQEVGRILSESSFMFDFQGHSAKYSAYLNGSYNHTILEALYYGAVPVVHKNMLKSGIPADCLITVDKIEDWISAVDNFDLDSYDREKAKRYVLENHSAEKLYDLIFEEFRDNSGKDYTQKKILNIPDIQEVAVVTSSIADTDEW